MTFHSAIKGFTTIELLVVITIVGILASEAIPSMRSLLLNQRIKSASMDVYAGLSYARSEAVARGLTGTVTMVPNVSTDWSQGWKVNFSTVTLKTADAISGLIITGPASITYRNDGRITAGQQTFLLKPNPNPGAIPFRCVITSPSGQPVMREDKNSDGNCSNG